jgi:LPXTG-motif cell wall-anchored protein
MKRIGLFFAIFLLANLPSFAQGIIFEEIPFEKALTKAKEENKLLFMDCYTEWCGPCKVMSRNVFVRREVGDFFNANLVNLKMDMEKGEGIALAKRYAVKAYPTMLLIRPDGTVQHRLVGSLDVLTLLERVQAGMKAKPEEVSSSSGLILVIVGACITGGVLLFARKRKRKRATT